MSDAGATPPLAFVIDDEVGICQFMASLLERIGFEIGTFQTAKDAMAAFDRRRPDIIFLDVALKNSDAVDVVHALSARAYGGVVQVMSGGNPVLLGAAQRIAERAGMILRPPLYKPFRGEAIRQIVAGLNAPPPPA